MECALSMWFIILKASNVSFAVREEKCAKSFFEICSEIALVFQPFIAEIT